MRIQGASALASNTTQTTLAIGVVGCAAHFSLPEKGYTIHREPLKTSPTTDLEGLKWFHHAKGFYQFISHQKKSLPGSL